MADEWEFELDTADDDDDDDDEEGLFCCPVSDWGCPGGGLSWGHEITNATSPKVSKAQTLGGAAMADKETEPLAEKRAQRGTGEVEGREE